MTVIAELNQIIQILEAEIPANPNSSANVKQKQRLEGELAKYFQKLEQAFPFEAIAKIYNRYVKVD